MEARIFTPTLFIFVCYQLFTHGVVKGLPFTSISSISSLKSSTESVTNLKSIPFNANDNSNNDPVNDSPSTRESSSRNFILLSPPPDVSSQNSSPSKNFGSVDAVNLVPLGTSSKLNLLASPIYTESNSQPLFIQSMPVEVTSLNSNVPSLDLSAPSVTPTLMIIPNLDIDFDLVNVNRESRDIGFLSQAALSNRADEPLRQCTEKPSTDSCYVTTPIYFGSPLQFSLTNVASDFKTSPPVSLPSPAVVTVSITQPNSLSNSDIECVQNLNTPPPNIINSDENNLMAVNSLNRQIMSLQSAIADNSLNIKHEPIQLINIDKLLAAKNNSSISSRNSYNSHSEIDTKSVSESINPSANNPLAVPQKFFVIDNYSNAFSNSKVDYKYPIETSSKNSNPHNPKDYTKPNTEQITFIPGIRNIPLTVYDYSNSPQITNNACSQVQIANLKVSESNNNNMAFNTAGIDNAVTLNLQNAPKIGSYGLPCQVSKSDNNVVYRETSKNENNELNRNIPTQEFSPPMITYSQNNKNTVRYETATNVAQSSTNNKICKISSLNSYNQKFEPVSFDNNKPFILINDDSNEIQKNNGNIVMNQQMTSKPGNVEAQKKHLDSKIDNEYFQNEKENYQCCPQLISLPLINKYLLSKPQNVNNDNFNNFDVMQNVNKNTIDRELSLSANDYTQIRSEQESTMSLQDINKIPVAYLNSNNANLKRQSTEDSLKTIPINRQNKMIIRKNNTAEINKILFQQNKVNRPGDISTSFEKNEIIYPENCIKFGYIGNKRPNTCQQFENNLDHSQDENQKYVITSIPKVSTQRNNNIPSYRNKLNCLATSTACNDNLVKIPNSIAIQPINAVNTNMRPQISLTAVNPLSSLEVMSPISPTISSQNAATNNNLRSFIPIPPSTINAEDTERDLLIPDNIKSVQHISSLNNIPNNPYNCFIAAEAKSITSNNILPSPNLNAVLNSRNNNDITLIPISLPSVAPVVPNMNIPNSYINTAPFSNQPLICNQNVISNNNLQTLLNLLNNNINKNGAATPSAAVNGISASNVIPVQSLPQVSFVNNISPTISVPPIQMIPSTNFIAPVSNLPIVSSSAPYMAIQPVISSAMSPFISNVSPQSNRIFEPRRIYSSINNIACSLTQNIISSLISKAVPSMSVKKLPPVNPATSNFNLDTDCDKPLRLDVAESLAPYLTSTPVSSTRLSISDIPIACNEYLPPISNFQSHDYYFDSEPYNSFTPFSYSSGSDPFGRRCSSIYKINRASGEAENFQRFMGSVVL